MAAEINLPPTGDTWFNGDTLVLLFQLTEEGFPVDITGASITFTAKKSPKDADNAIGAIQKTVSSGVTIEDAADGLFTVTIDPVDTSKNTSDTIYYYDVQLLLTGDTITGFYGTISLKADVTQA